MYVRMFVCHTATASAVLKLKDIMDDTSKNHDEKISASVDLVLNSVWREENLTDEQLTVAWLVTITDHPD